MTLTEYENIKAKIDSKYREQMAALEMIWSFTNGENPPESPVRHTEDAAISAAEASDDQPVRLRGEASDQGKLDDAKKKRAREYARAYYRKHHPHK